MNVFCAAEYKELLEIANELYILKASAESVLENVQFIELEYQHKRQAFLMFYQLENR